MSSTSEVLADPRNVGSPAAAPSCGTGGGYGGFHLLYILIDLTIREGQKIPGPFELLRPPTSHNPVLHQINIDLLSEQQCLGTRLIGSPERHRVALVLSDASLRLNVTPARLSALTVITGWFKARSPRAGGDAGARTLCSTCPQLTSLNPIE